MNTFNYALSSDQLANTRFTNFGEAVGYALPKALFGFAVVFGVLILIWGILALFKVFFYTIPNSANKSASDKSAKKEAVKATAAPVAQQTVSTAVPTDDSALVAAITAAISAFRQQNGEANGGFRVVSFKKRK